MTPRLPIRRTRLARVAADDGFALVFISVMLVVLFGLTAFVTDWGAMWMSRRQAQNAADAGALAGAVARAFDDTATTPAIGGPAHTAAVQAALANKVWKADPGVLVSSWDCPSFVAAAGRCVTVDVFRDGSNGSAALPAYFGVLFGRTELKTKARAIAQAVPANATTCLRPWAVPDKWIPNLPPDETFDRYVPNGQNAGDLLPGVVDEYVPPPAGGYNPVTDKGQQVTLMFSNASGPVNSGWFLAVDIPRADGGGASGAARYKENIESCNGIATHIGQYLMTESGAMVGPTRDSVADLIALDPDATWNIGTKTIQGGCLSRAVNPCAMSPRVVAIAVFDPDDFAKRSALNDTTVCPGGGQCVKVTNIFAFFIEGQDAGGNVTGRLMEELGEYDEGWNVLPPESTFLWSVRLVQ